MFPNYVWAFQQKSFMILTRLCLRRLPCFYLPDSSILLDLKTPMEISKPKLMLCGRHITNRPMGLERISPHAKQTPDVGNGSQALFLPHAPVWDKLAADIMCLQSISHISRGQNGVYTSCSPPSLASVGGLRSERFLVPKWIFSVSWRSAETSAPTKSCSLDSMDTLI